MIIKKVTDEGFRKYGKVVEGIDFTELLEKLDKTPLPEDTVYVASDSELEATDAAKQLCKRSFGELPIQVGYCNGHNKKLNAVEYHRCSEINIAQYDMILLIGDERDITEDFTYDTSLIEAFLVPAGTAVEMYGTTLHYAPCHATDKGFRCIVVLPRGTNAPLDQYPETMGEDRLLMAVNKWLIAHKDGGQNPRAVRGLKGLNIEIK